MKIHDISLTIKPNTPVWPGDIPVWLQRAKKIEEGEEDNLSQMKMGVHTGTHLDAPYHFVNEGKKIDEIPLDTFYGTCQVIQLGDEVDLITARELAKTSIDRNIPRILFKTRNSREWLQPNPVFKQDFVGISVDGAEMLVEMGMKLVGLDYLSVAPYNSGKPVHDVFLQAGLVLLEGADLSRIDPGKYQLICLPLKLDATEGSPTRAILVEE
jgi:arylformamidase